MSEAHNDLTPNTPRPAGYLCYVNGILVPVVSVTVTAPVNDIPTAQIVFFPSKSLFRLGAEDRVEVTIFYLDTHYAPDKPEFRLLFDGEIFAWDYRASPEGRQLSVTAAADISVFQQVFYNLLNTTQRAGTFIATPGASTSTVGQSRPSVYFGLSLLQEGLFFDTASRAGEQPETVKPTIRRPYDLLFNAVMGMTAARTKGGSVPAEVRSIPVVNFFCRWARKRNFINRFVALPDFDDARASDDDYVFPLIRSAKAYSALLTIQKNIVEDGGNGSIWDILSRAFQDMYYEIAMLTSPPAVRAKLATGEIASPASVASSDPKKNPIRLASYYAKPTAPFSVPPTCNVLFPSLVRSISYSENYRTQPTRTYCLDDSLFNSVPNPDPALGAMYVAYPPAAQAGMHSRHAVTPDGMWPADQSANPNLTGRNLLIWPEEFYKGPVVQSTAIPGTYGFLARGIGLDKGAEASAEGNVEGSPENLRVRVLLDLYAETEYYRSRYAARGGAVSSVFNPYLVPGYGTVIFDRAGGLHQMAYAHTVQHTLSKDGMFTEINYSMGRTLNEWLALLKNESERLGVVLGSVPPEPVDDVRQVLQDPARAAKHYQKLFHPGGVRSVGRVPRVASFNPTTMLLAGGRPIQFSGPTESTVPLQSRPQRVGTDGKYSATDGNRAAVRATVDFTGEITPTKAYADVFQNTNDALTYVARPVCTLDEYVMFLHGVATPDAAPAAHVNGKHRPLEGCSAHAYQRIKKLAYTAGTPSGVGGVTVRPARSVGSGTNDVAVVPASAPANLPPHERQTRVDWDQVLLSYRQEVLFIPGPKE